MRCILSASPALSSLSSSRPSASTDESSSRSRALTAELVRDADYIFCMTHSHVDAVTLLYPLAAEKTFLLREFEDLPFADIATIVGCPLNTVKSRMRYALEGKAATCR